MSRRVALFSVVTLMLATTASSQGAPRFGTWGYDKSAMDAAVKPGDDFFNYVNGAWAKRANIAPDRTYVGIDSVLNDRIERDVRAIVEDMARDPAKAGSAGAKVGDYYASFKDQAAIDKAGTAPLRPHLARVAAVRDRTGLLDLFTDQSFTSPVGIYISADPEDPTRYATYATQSGLGLPNRDYYLLPGAKYDGFRAAYRAYVIRMQSLAGIGDAAARADRIIALEKAIATAHWTPERSRDVKQTNNAMTRAQLAALAPQLDWSRSLSNMGLGGQRKVIVRQPSAIAAVGRLLATFPLSTWKDYLAFHFIRNHASILPRAFDDAHFAFYSKTLRDVQVQRERWKRGIDAVDSALGEAVGQIYVARHYPPASDRQMGELVSNIRGALGDLIERSSWMDAATQKEALAKLASFDPRLGHPAKYIDYSALRVTRGQPLANAVAASAFQWKLELSRLPRPIDRTLWYMTPQTNNAYYDASTNQITFPAAILQPPYFDPNADPASNYGSIGATIGHEIGHGFDDQGRQYDSTGKLRDWWTPAAARAYESRTGILVKQYNTYEPVPGTRIKGQLTLGENIGDLGGLEMAYAAYRRHVARHGEPPVIDELTGDQRFFIAYGYSWQTKTREGALRQQLLTGPHSPARYRVNGAVRNMDAWYKAFDVQPGDKLYLSQEQRVRIW